MHTYGATLDDRLSRVSGLGWTTDGGTTSFGVSHAYVGCSMNAVIDYARSSSAVLTLDRFIDPTYTGVGATPGVYAGQWRLLECRSDESYDVFLRFTHGETARWLWRSRYIDELVGYMIDRRGLWRRTTRSSRMRCVRRWRTGTSR